MGSRVTFRLSRKLEEWARCYMTVSAFTLSTLALQVSVLDIATGLPGAFGSE